MLGKLIKHELKSQYKTFFILYIITFALNIILKIYSNIVDTESDNIVTSVVLGLLITAVVIINVVVIIFTFCISVTNFNKSMMKDEAYLTHTLPVHTWELLLSKLIAYIIWTLGSLLIIYISVAIQSENPLFLFSESNEFLEDFVTGFNSVEGQQIPSVEQMKDMLGFSFILSFVSCIVLMLQIYLSIAIGQLFNKHKGGMSFVAFVGIYIVNQFIGVLLVNIGSVKMLMEEFTYSSTINTMLLSLVEIVVEGIAAFFIANYLFKRHLNVE